jgi:hypothetical protein
MSVILLDQRGSDPNGTHTLIETIRDLEAIHSYTNTSNLSDDEWKKHGINFYTFTTNGKV